MAMLDKPFTLTLIPKDDDPTVTELVDEHGVAHYRKQRIPGPAYGLNVTDPLSGATLATATAPAATSKHKTIELHNPSVKVELKYVGTISFRWSFKWEAHEFEWKREECYMIRKPDPPVLVAITKEPPGRIKTSNVQILDYNLNRFDIEDRKGFEIVLLAALLTFQDSNEAARGTPPVPSREGSSSAIPNAGRAKQLTVDTPLPGLPSKPTPRFGSVRIQEKMAARGEHNEVLVDDDDTVKEYARVCVDLIADEAMLFITIRSATSVDVSKVLLVVDEVKRIKRREDINDEELHQYVLYDKDKVTSEHPKTIHTKSKEKGKDRATPRHPEAPNSLTIYLSKIPMPELEPRVRPRINLDARPAPAVPAVPALQAPPPRRRELSSPRPPSPPPIESSGRHRKDKGAERDLERDQDRHRKGKKSSKAKLEKDGKKKKDRPPPPEAYGYGSAATGSAEVRPGFSPITPAPSFPYPRGDTGRSPVGPSFMIPPLHPTPPPRTSSRRNASESYAFAQPAPTLPPPHVAQAGPGIWVAPARQGVPLNPQAGQPVGIFDRIWG